MASGRPQAGAPESEVRQGRVVKPMGAQSDQVKHKAEELLDTAKDKVDRATDKTRDALRRR